MTAPPSRAPLNLSTAAVGLSLVLLGLFAAGGWWGGQRVRALPAVAITSAASARGAVPETARPSPGTALPSDEAGPLWLSLSAAQQEALRPLEAHWSTLTEAQKQRWVAIAAGFHKLSPARKAKIQENMAAWASLSPQQRSRARLNYAATKKIAPPSKQEQWEAYQALSAEEKKQLASKAAPPPQGAAIVVRPAPVRKFARVPATAGVPTAVPNPPKILPPNETTAPMPPLPEARPRSEPTVVETVPVQIPSAAPTPLPPLGPPAVEPATPPAPSAPAFERPASGEQ